MNPLFGTPDTFPLDAVVPAPWQLVFTIAFGIPAFAFCIYAIYLLIKEKDLVPLLIMIGAAIATYEEPIVDVLAKCWWPAVGQWTAIEAFDRPIPWLCVFAYMAYYGGMVILLARAFEKGVSRKQFFTVFYIAIIANVAMEPIPLNLGLWMYYGDQPFAIFGYPLYWPVNNALAAMVTATLIYKLRPHLRGFSLLLLLPLVLTGNLISNAAVMWPVWTALNWPYGYAATIPAALLTFALCAAAARVLAAIVATNRVSESISPRSPHPA